VVEVPGQPVAAVLGMTGGAVAAIDRDPIKPLDREGVCSAQRPVMG